MRRSLGPLVLLAILGLPAFIAPAVGWHPAGVEPTDEIPAASFDYFAPIDHDEVAAPAEFQVMLGASRLALQDNAASTPVTITSTDRVYLRDADEEPADLADAANEPLHLVARARTTSFAIEATDEDQESVRSTEPLPFRALLVLEAQRTMVAVGLAVHPGVSSAMTRIGAVPVPSMSMMQAAAFTTTTDAVPGVFLHVAWILLLVAIGLSMRPALFAGALALFSRFNQGDILHNERRSRLFCAIQADPGARFGELCQRAQLAAGVAQHHLRLLEQHELVRRTRDGRATRFYPQGPRFDPPALRSATRQRLVDLLREHPAIDTKQLAQRLGQRPQSTWHHLHVLQDAGVLAPIRRGRLIRWNVLAR